MVDLSLLDATREKIYSTEQSRYKDDISFGHLIYLATQFDDFKYPNESDAQQVHDNFKLFVSQISELGPMLQSDSMSDISKHIGICFLLGINMIVNDYGIFSPYDYLWIKYYDNVYKYQLYTAVVESTHRAGLVLTEDEMDLAKSVSKSYFPEHKLRSILRKLRGDKLITIPKELTYSTTRFQKLQFEWLLTLGDDFTPSKLYRKLLDEVDELNVEVSNYIETGKDMSKILAGFECTDVLIYLIQILNIMDIDLSKVLSSLDTTEYFKVLGLDENVAMRRKYVRDVRWYRWFARSKFLWLTSFY